MSKSLVEMAADIVTSQKYGSIDEVTSALDSTFKSLMALQNQEEGVDPAPVDEVETPAKALDPKKSIKKNMIICLECGQEFRTLSPKHLLGHGLTAKEYRKKYGFTARQPLCAKSLSDARSASGKARGIPAALAASIAKRKKKADATA